MKKGKSNMKSYILGVTPRLTKEDNVEKAFVNQRYLRPFIEENIIPIVLPLEVSKLDPILSICDGFLVTGGTDIDPILYNQTNEDGISKGIDARLDTIDQLVVQYAYSQRRPLLGICRGHQAINVFLGGSLYQDLEEKTPNHQKIPSGQQVTLIGGSIFKEILPSSFAINSYHHQAIKDLAPGFIVAAISDDDVIEAVEHTTHPIIGVQWHPEINARSEISKPIFDYIIKLIKKERSS